jgi:predicted phosphodiesterase
MRTLLLSDIHHRHARAQRIIESVPHDKVVLLGDYFDQYQDKESDAQATAEWLRDFVIPNKKIVPLLGNHDVPYFYNHNPHFRCSGFSFGKSIVINNVLTDEHKENFKFYHIDQGFVLIHAGVTNPRWKEMASKFEESKYATKLEFFDAVLSYFVENGIKSAKLGYDVGLFNAGWDRGGIERHGGINWVDWRNFAPINGINQIVGHTIHRVPEILVQREGGAISVKSVIDYYKKPYNGNVLSVSYALDTSSNHYIVIEDGVVKVYDYQTGLDLNNLGGYWIPDSNLNTIS